MHAATHARPEYDRLGRDFARLAEGFGLTLTAQARDDVWALAACIECIDRVLDALAERRDRVRLGDALVSALRGAGGPVDGWGDELRAQAAVLVALVRRRGVASSFARVTAHALENSERMRACTTRDEYVTRVAREGRLTARLALLVAGEECAAGPFARFFVALGEPANLVDKLLDARGDAERGELSLRAGIRLHVRLAFEIVRRLPALLRLYPRRGWLLAWGAGYLLAPNKIPVAPLANRT